MEVWPRPTYLWQARFFSALPISKHIRSCHVTYDNHRSAIKQGYRTGNTRAWQCLKKTHFYCPVWVSNRLAFDFLFISSHKSVTSKLSWVRPLCEMLQSCNHIIFASASFVVFVAVARLPCAFASICLYLWSCLCLCSFIYLSVCLLIFYSFTHSFVRSSIHSSLDFPFIFSSIYLSYLLFMYVFIHLFTHLSIRLFILRYISFYFFIYLLNISCIHFILVIWL